MRFKTLYWNGTGNIVDSIDSKVESMVEEGWQIHDIQMVATGQTGRIAVFMTREY